MLPAIRKEEICRNIKLSGKKAHLYSHDLKEHKEVHWVFYLRGILSKI
ncbi:MAG: hypothetical protein PHF18_00495 [Methanosarcina sp.]|nr:hypothetical protein [Methanosarcina sp.]MDD3245342.1 hypothetical protein [Methanosarcina sp.]MDD4249613.1 hypothetical protein [Methanosarcina sp.]